MKQELAEIVALEPPDAARRLLGCELTISTAQRIIRARITETEAYTIDDPASHSFKGKSARNAAMFGAAGDIYVYFIYGLHYCLNIVTGIQKGGAVLIRSIEIIDGKSIAWQRRYNEPLPSVLTPVKNLNLTNGPAKVAEALGVTLHMNQASVFDPDGPIHISAKPEAEAASIQVTQRIGITKGADTPWRFVLKSYSSN